ncbi:accessory Sec system protein Asp1 [Liquorilactobacillus satsumensis]|uniref:accessory Sec system protein Asp1 n=1 Tax=Liquorilactobacillus satsumensis TaxID=259059 RepID=UPI0021C32BEF|nr:accessory Sec system protein Asp1 [Liquorilactobacillus satsumensis]MCP9358460.1 accessory Sec system protein Asp1 [Liquorilactobacillus satsumensis]MCP9372414.1 accessory Sec system protein Asp1 [Liquorilactobacillus satsumensis]
MFYLLPSWNNKSACFWNNTPLPWYRGTKKMEFDETVNQLRMFYDAQERTKALILNYSPNLRTFLQRENIFETEYYSIFDELQNIKTKNTRTFDFKSLTWPPDVAFSYTPFLVIARRQGKPWARIEFDSMGKVLEILFLKQSLPTKKLVFDDRGFLSSIIYYDTKGIAKEQKFLDQAGRWQFKLDLRTETYCVDVNPDFRTRFSRLRYPDIKDLLMEKYQLFLEKNLSQKDLLIIAAERIQTARVLKAQSKARMVLSFFNKRYPLTDHKNLLHMINNADCCVADTNYNVEKIKKILRENGIQKEVIQVTPFDSRLELGKSQSVKELKIFLLISGLSAVRFSKILKSILSFMEKQPLAELIIAAYPGQSSQSQAIKQQVTAVLKQEKLNDIFTFEQEKNKLSITELALSGHNVGETRDLQWLALESEDDLISALADVRLIIDLSAQPDLFLQIAGISAGIPQINLTDSSYVEHGRNGLIIESIKALPDAIAYYFTGLAHWNEALVYSANKISEYSGENLVSKWKQIMKGAEHDVGTD